MSDHTTPAGYGEPGRLGVEYELLELPADARTDVTLLLRVRVRNTSRITWPNRGAHPINLSYHWLDPDGEMVDFDGVRTPLPEPLPPGGAVVLDLPVEPPPGPGRYQLALDMVEEWIGWFSNQGVPPLVVPVEVAQGATKGPRACIIGPLCLVNDAVGNAMVNQLLALQARGYDALILVEHVELKQPARLRRHMRNISLADLLAGTQTPLTRRALAHFRSADLYVFHYPLPYPLFEALAALDRGVAVVDYHGVTPRQFWQGEGRDAFFEQHARQMQLLRYADYAVAHSDYMRQELLSSGAIAPERVYVNALAVPLARFSPGPRRADLLARYGLAGAAPLLLYVGRMASHKRVIDLVRALPLIRHALPHAALLLVGDDTSPFYVPVAAEARAVAQELGVADGLAFAGQVDDAELPDHYRLADLFVTASLHEGFCVPVLEAMACGVPVVGAHATALPGTIGEAGLTFEPENPADLAAKVLALLESRYAATQRAESTTDG